MSQTVIGFFRNAQDANDAKQQLIAKGFSSANIDVSSSSSSGSSYGTSGYTSGTSGSDLTGSSTTSGYGSTTGSDTNYGSTSGSDLTGSSTTSGYGSTTGTSGSSYGSTDSTHDRDDDSFGEKVSHFFKNLFGGDDDDADKYSTVARRAGTLVTVHASSNEEAERAADILDDAGAADVDELANEYGYRSGSTGTTGLTGTSDYAGTSGTNSAVGAASTYNADNTAEYTTPSAGVTSDYSAGSGTTGLNTGVSADYDSTDRTSNLDTTDSTNTGDTLKVIKEDLQVGKREVVTGGVRLRSRIVERPIQESLRLREENVTVERTPVDRVATEADFNTFKEGEIEMTERSEVPVINKEARVVEEVRVGKDVSERVETINDTVRDTQVDVEKFDQDDTNTTR